MLHSIVARIQSVFAWWMADIRKRKSLLGKVISLFVGIFVLFCACIFGLAMARGAGQAVGIVPTNTATPIPSATPLPTSTAVPTDTPVPTPIPSPTIAPSSTPQPTPRPTRTPIPTETMIPTFTPVPTIETDTEGVAPVDGKCNFPYYIKISQNGFAHSTSSRSYSRTNPIHCYATMKDAIDHGYEEAND